MKILVAVDDKEFAKATVDFLAEHDWTPGTEFKIINIVEGYCLPGENSLAAKNLAEERARRGRSLVIDTALKLQQALAIKSVKIDHAVETGQAKEKILEYAESWPAEMIVMGSHGRQGLTRFLLGSVSMSVLSHAQCSVVIVKLPALEHKRQERRATKIAKNDHNENVLVSTKESVS